VHATLCHTKRPRDSAMAQLLIEAEAQRLDHLPHGYALGRHDLALGKSPRGDGVGGGIPRTRHSVISIERNERSASSEIRDQLLPKRAISLERNGRSAFSERTDQLRPKSGIVRAYRRYTPSGKLALLAIALWAAAAASLVFLGYWTRINGMLWLLPVERHKDQVRRGPK
jgi:hypothetical protein